MAKKKKTKETKTRVEIPPKLAAQLLAANDHTCCICTEARKHVAIHHIDGDPSNNDWENICVVCHDCHSRVTGNEGLGRRFSEDEVRIYKEQWETACAGEDQDDGEEPSDSEYEVTSLDPEQYASYVYGLEEGDLITVSLESNRPLDAFICRESAFRRWEKNTGEIRNCLDSNEGFYECDLEAEVERDGEYVLVVFNPDEEKRAKVIVDLAIWDPEDEEDEES